MTNSAKNPKVAMVEAWLAGLNRNVFGYTKTKEQIVNTILCAGHVILVSKPGLAKTKLLMEIAGFVADAQTWSEQFTADMRPSDIKGSRIWNPDKKAFEAVPGPIVGKDLILADELNRAQGKTNSALLRPMQERFIMIGEEKFPMNPLFTVMAAINPIEQLGVFPLPEAQLNRFMFELIMGYETFENEKKMLRNPSTFGRKVEGQETKPVITIPDILEIRQHVLDIALNASDEAVDLVLHLNRATRPDDGDEYFKKIFKLDADGKELEGQTFEGLIADGASPRAEIAVLLGAGAVAWRAGREKILPDDIKHVFRDATRHRLYLTDNAKNAGFNPDDFITSLLYKVPLLAGIKA